MIHFNADGQCFLRTRAPWHQPRASSQAQSQNTLSSWIFCWVFIVLVSEKVVWRGDSSFCHTSNIIGSANLGLFTFWWRRDSGWRAWCRWDDRTIVSGPCLRLRLYGKGNSPQFTCRSVWLFRADCFLILSQMSNSTSCFILIIRPPLFCLMI